MHGREDVTRYLYWGPRTREDVRATLERLATMTGFDEMRREAHLRENEFVKGEWTDQLIYAMPAGEWRTPH